jgi:hypothetical protein
LQPAETPIAKRQVPCMYERQHIKTDHILTEFQL